MKEFLRWIEEPNSWCITFCWAMLILALFFGVGVTIKFFTTWVFA